MFSKAEWFRKQTELAVSSKLNYLREVLKTVSITEQKLPSAQGLGLSKPWVLLLTLTEGCSLKSLTQVCTVRLYRYNMLREW